MATTSFLYHTLGLAGYRHIKTEYRKGCVFHHVELHPHKRRCEDCGARWDELTLEGRFEREFRALPVGMRPQFVVLHGHRQKCGRCGRTLREPVSFADGQRRYLKSFARYVVGLCGFLPVKDVALILGVGWDLVKEIFKEHLRSRFKRRKLGKIRYLAVDEFSTHKGHKYMTVVLDLETGEILYAREGKDAAALKPFLEKLKRRRAPLRAVAVDMSAAYVRAVEEVFGKTVDIVHDPFHVVAQAGKAVDETRRDMVRELEGEEKKALKGSRFLLLKGLENLKADGLERLMRLMELNEPLYKAYLLKEDLRQFWSLPDRKSGEAFLNRWIMQALFTANRHFVKLAETLHACRERLLSYFAHRISTGPLEGLNNKIKVLKRQAYGFRDMEYFRLRLYFLHEAKARPCLPG